MGRLGNYILLSPQRETRYTVSSSMDDCIFMGVIRCTHKMQQNSEISYPIQILWALLVKHRHQGLKQLTKDMYFSFYFRCTLSKGMATTC